MSEPRPATLDHAAIEALVPHRGAMCLLDRLLSWSDTRIECVAVGHRSHRHPLRTKRGLLACAAIEYAAQSAALHGALAAQGLGREAPPGALVGARDVRLAVLRLDDLPATDGADELRVVAIRRAGDATHLLYAFTVDHGGREIATGRLAVVLQTATHEEAR